MEQTNINSSSRVEQLLEQQNQLLQQLLEFKTEQTRAARWGQRLGWIKHVVYWGAISWVLLRAQQFLVSMFDKITPDFSGIQNTVTNSAAAAGDSVQDLLQGFGF